MALEVLKKREKSIKSKENDITKIMRRVFIALLIVLIYSAVMQSIYFHPAYGVKVILIALTTVAGAYLTEMIVMSHFFDDLVYEKLKKEAKKTYPLITGLILALMLPTGIPLLFALIGSIVAILLGKMVFGGFGSNIFNPALIGYVFILLSWPNAIVSGLGNSDVDWFLKLIFNVPNADTVMGATYGLISYSNLFSTDLWKLLVGGTTGSIGASARLLIIMIGVYFGITKTINWRLPVVYLASSFLLFTVAYIGTKNPVGYALTEVFTGGLIFGAVFVIVDPVTSPTSNYNKIKYAIGAAAVVVYIRTIGASVDGVMYSILFMNMLVPLLNSSNLKRSKNKLSKQIISIVILVLIVVLCSYYFGMKLTDIPSTFSR